MSDPKPSVSAQKPVKAGKAARAARVAEKAKEMAVKGEMTAESMPVATASQTNSEIKIEKDTPESGKSKAELRKERKATQEAQRAKKAKGIQSTASNKDTTLESVKQPQKQKSPLKEVKTGILSKDSNPLEAQLSKLSLKSCLKTQDSFSSSINNLEAQQTNKSKLFHHFDQFNRDYSVIEKHGIDNPSIHPAFIKYGIECANDRLIGSNERCLGFLHALQKFFYDYKAPSNENKTISKDLDSKLKPNINFLCHCRPLAVSVANAIKEIKQVILYFPSDITEVEAKETLKEEIERFIDEKILLAWETISKYTLADSDTVISGTSYVKSKITNDDCILVYGYSSLIAHLLIRASRKFPKLRVVVVDSRPGFRGKNTMEQLVKHGIDCTYILINGISFIMKQVTKVFLGAHALLANGYVMSNIGSSQIALVAKSFNVPVVVCCETYKFCDKVQTDALINNELGDPLKMLSNLSKKRDSPLAEWKAENKDSDNINLLNLTYDITSPNFISCVITDMGMLPCSSVPVVIRIKNRDHIQLSLKKSDKSTNS